MHRTCTSCSSCGGWHRALSAWLTCTPGLVPGHESMTPPGWRSVGVPVGVFPPNACCQILFLPQTCRFYHFTFIFLSLFRDKMISRPASERRYNSCWCCGEILQMCWCGAVLSFPSVRRGHSAPFNEKIKLVPHQMAKQMSESATVHVRRLRLPSAKRSRRNGENLFSALWKALMPS